MRTSGKTYTTDDGREVRLSKTRVVHAACAVLGVDEKTARAVLFQNAPIGESVSRQRVHAWGIEIGVLTGSESRPLSLDALVVRATASVEAFITTFQERTTKTSPPSPDGRELDRLLADLSARKATAEEWDAAVAEFERRERGE